MKDVLEMALSRYKTKHYSELASLVDNRNGDCLEHIEDVWPDGTEFQIELNAYWDNLEGDPVRITGSLSAEPQQSFLKMAYFPNRCDSFIMAENGSLVE